jgi:hypothetical protein
MQIRIKRVIESTLNDEEFETVLLALNELSGNHEHPPSVRSMAQHMYEGYIEAARGEPGTTFES